MKNLFLLVAVILCCTGCGKKNDGPKLPDATHNGANTFGCKIDGEVFTVSGKSYLGQPDGVKAIAYTNTAWFVYGQLGKKHITLEFDYNSSPHVPGSFLMADNYPSQGNYFYYPDGTVPTGSTQFSTDSSHYGYVNLTNYTSTFVSGTFAFDAINGDGKVVHITDGRFDISF